MSKVTMPEPVAKVHVGNPVRYEHIDAWSLDVGTHYLITTTQAEAYAAAKVRGALEEALARVGDYGHFPPFTAFENGYDRGREKACAIIRALIPKENT